MRQASNSAPQYAHPFSLRAEQPLRASQIDWVFFHQFVMGYGAFGSGRSESVIQESTYRPLPQR